MVNLKQRQFLLISNSERFKQLTREKLHLFGSITHCKTIICAKRDLETGIFSTIIIDEDIQSEDLDNYNSLLLLICTKNLSNSVIVFFSKGTQPNIYQYYKYGIQNIFPFSFINLFLEPIIRKILALIPETDTTVLRDRGITLYLNQSYAIFRGCRILLSNTEKLILNYLLKKCSLCSKAELSAYLVRTLGREISAGYLTTNISRLRKKFLKHTGINIVKNRNGFGYYLSI